VLSDNRQMQLSIIVPFGLLVIGFTVASWARKGGITRGGLQAALAAVPPAKPGGPTSCRQCGAPLAPAAGAHAARCAYCQADNLVELPPAWIATMRAQATKLTQETRKAAKLWEQERRALRRSLFKRFVLWTAVLLVPMWFIMGAAAGKSSDRAPGEPGSWQKAMEFRYETSDCNEATDGIALEPVCSGEACTFSETVALRRGEVVRHVSRDLPAGSVVDLQMHDQTWFGDRWKTVASSPVSAGHPGATEVPYSGWYKVRVTVPQPVKKAYAYCGTVK
jgi:LSD1 subclass zinc finger protein